MLLAAAALSFSLDLTDVASRYVPAMRPKPTCSIRVVSHKFIGQPGTRFEYGGKMFEIPPGGALELIARKGIETYRVNGVTQLLGTSLLNEFGTSTVQLP